MFRLACAILNIRNHPNQNATLCPVTIPLTDSTTDDRDPFCCSEVGSDEEDNPSVLEEFVRDLTARTKSASFKRLEKEMLEDEESSDTEVPLNPRDPDYEGMDQDLIPTFNDEPEREQRPGLGFEPLEGRGRDVRSRRCDTYYSYASGTSASLAKRYPSTCRITSLGRAPRKSVTEGKLLQATSLQDPQGSFTPQAGCQGCQQVHSVILHFLDVPLFFLLIFPPMNSLLTPHIDLAFGTQKSALGCPISDGMTSIVPRDNSVVP